MSELFRRSGVLLHVSSLPGDYGCGTFGRAAFSFLDLLADCGFSLWQVLPFCEPDAYGSPYKSPSAFSVNPCLIDPETLRDKGLITAGELAGARQSDPFRAEFGRLARERLPLLFSAADRTDAETRNRILAFAEREQKQREFCEWAARKRFPGDKGAAFRLLFCAFEFAEEWKAVRAHAKKKGVKILGDIPIYVDAGGCDTNLYPELFLLDGERRPLSVAGVPPDLFSAEGQLWGNPLYNWERMAKDGFSWWRERIRFCFSFFDELRIDHFRAVEAYYAIPAQAKTAKEGRWVKGPGMPFVDAIREAAGGGGILAEDLGVSTPSLLAFLRETGLPGMRVLQFADFGGDPRDVHLPYNYPANTAAYSGTHDNDTLLGWVRSLPPDKRRHAFVSAGYQGEDERAGCMALMRELLFTRARTVVFPIQDLLFYGSDARMNTPGVPEGCWRFRLGEGAWDRIDRGWWRYLNRLSGRLTAE